MWPLLSVRVCKLLCPWAPLKGPLHIIVHTTTPPVTINLPPNDTEHVPVVANAALQCWARKKNSPQSGTSPSTLESRVLHNRQSGKLIVSRLERLPPLDFVHIRLESSCACLRPGSTTFPKGGTTAHNTIRNITTDAFFQHPRRTTNPTTGHHHK